MSKPFAVGACALAFCATASVAQAMDLQVQTMDRSSAIFIDKDSIRRDGPTVTASTWILFPPGSWAPLHATHMSFSIQYDCDKGLVRDRGSVFYDGDDRAVATEPGADHWGVYGRNMLPFLCQGSAPPDPRHYASLAEARVAYEAWLGGH